jgi:hypothetical protein
VFVFHTSYNENRNDAHRDGDDAIRRPVGSGDPIPPIIPDDHDDDDDHYDYFRR